MFKNILYLLLFSLIISCDDGDVFVSKLDFDDNLEYCEGGNDVVIYKINTTPNESLSIKVPNTVLSYFETIGEETVNLSATNTFNYRSYTGNPVGLFCNSLPASEPLVTNNSVATSGVIKFLTILIEDDNDGIPAHLEGQDPNTDGDFSDALDTDNDGVPNYLDSDDDGDNVPTVFENPNPNNDNDLSDAQDTDADGIPDYLDIDDDGDGTITRYEDANGDKDPTNDIFDATIGVDYLNPSANTITVIDLYKNHTKNQEYDCILSIEDMILINANSGEVIINENFAFGVIKTVNNNIDYPVVF